MNLFEWWNTTCETCLKLRRLITDAAKLALSLFIIILMLFSGLLFYWILLDTEPAIHYGDNGRAEFYQNRIIFHLDATRMRNCPTMIHRKIDGCGQIDLSETIATTAIGNQAGPLSYSLDILFQAFSREQLSGNVCHLTNVAYSYCNPAQRLLHLPIVTQSPPIFFIPVPRAKSYDRPEQP